MKERIAVLMSGGVDSSVAAALLLEQGNDICGLMMKPYASRNEEMCPDAKDARAVADKLGIPFYLEDFSELFEKYVIREFALAYDRGETPNPCVVCNKYIKFGALLDRAVELGYDKVATGHYALVEFDEGRGRYLLKRAGDIKKDQSYMLYSLSQDQLSHVRLPLSSLSKDRIRELAAQKGLLTAHKSDSQDICFVQDGEYAEFIENYLGRKYPEGEFVDDQGKVLGTHKGYIRYTLGQRKGLGVAAGKPIFVSAKNVEENKIVLSPEEALFSRNAEIINANLIISETIEDGMRVMAKSRYRHIAEPARVWQTGPSSLHVEYDKAVRAITPGQSMVLYLDEYVVGGGIIR